eukprot:NODE_1457_length_1728_cov_117.503427_g1381_i0.p1 GENE.NODE_1457_length_1728_cov_117.503427_g1381_i0~~NODE_1457_length_1728_cov_117.503427_g1381_i0.p1  ORF type:complete len:529 (+),score=78.50 NODE_1457_length_1728_cov_117.503427_g1381_i0:54-1640(+)
MAKKKESASIKSSPTAGRTTRGSSIGRKQLALVLSVLVVLVGCFVAYWTKEKPKPESSIARERRLRRESGIVQKPWAKADGSFPAPVEPFIDRVDISAITDFDAFWEEYEHKAVIVAGAAKHWDAMKFGDKATLVRKYGEVEIPIRKTRSAMAAQFQLLEEHEEPLEAFVNDMDDDVMHFNFGIGNLGHVMMQFGEFSSPPFVRSKIPEDEWEYLLSMGCNGNGLPFHNHGDAWLGTVVGTKRWFVYPPNKQANNSVDKSHAQILLQNPDKWASKDGLYYTMQPEHRPLAGDTIGIGAQTTPKRKSDTLQEWTDLNNRWPGSTFALLRMGLWHVFKEDIDHDLALKYFEPSASPERMNFVGTHGLIRTYTNLKQWNKAINKAKAVTAQLEELVNDGYLPPADAVIALHQYGLQMATIAGDDQIAIPSIIESAKRQGYAIYELTLKFGATDAAVVEEYSKAASQIVELFPQCVWALKVLAAMHPTDSYFTDGAQWAQEQMDRLLESGELRSTRLVFVAPHLDEYLKGKS